MLSRDVFNDSTFVPPCRKQVDSSKVADFLYPLIIAEEEVGIHGLCGKTKGGLTLGTRALSAFRQLYRYAWEEPRVSEPSSSNWRP